MARLQTETVSHFNHYSIILTGQGALLPSIGHVFILSFTQARWCVERRVDFGIRKPRNPILEDLGLVPLPELLQRLNGNCNTG